MNKIENPITKWVALALCLLVMAMIFFFSAKEAAVSDLQSGGIVNAIADAIQIEETSEKFDTLTVIVRKTGHILEFALLSFCFYFYFHHFAISCKLRSFFSFLLTLGYAATDELHQIFVPGRAGKITDVLIDSVGAILGIVFYLVMLRLVQKIKEREKSPFKMHRNKKETAMPSEDEKMKS